MSIKAALPVIQYLDEYTAHTTFRRSRDPAVMTRPYLARGHGGAVSEPQDRAISYQAQCLNAAFASLPPKLRLFYCRLIR